MKLRVTAFGMAVGVFLAVGFFVATAFSVLFGTGGHIGYLAWILPWFDRNWLGAFIGLVGGFVEGFIVGSAFAWLYNRILRALEK